MGGSVAVAGCTRKNRGMGDFILVYTGEMNNEDITGKLVFLCCTVSDSVYADTDQTYDIFWGMLVKDKKDTMFVRCDSPSLKMKIVRMADANTENIDKAYQIFNQKTKNQFILLLSVM